MAKLETIEFPWNNGRPTKDMVQSKAPKGAICAVLHGSVWGWTKSYDVEYYDEDVVMDELRFSCEPINKYEICKRKKFTLK